MRVSPKFVLERYELTDREQRRLIRVVWQRGMSVSCTLYRINRMTPLYTLLPLTCNLLGEELVPLGELFWVTFRDSDLQFKPEIDRFARFLRDRMDSGLIQDPYLREVLDFEQALNALSFAAFQGVSDGVVELPEENGHGLFLHPQVRVVAFRHDPLATLDALSRRSKPSEPIEGEFFLLIDGRTERLEIVPADARFGRILLEAAASKAGISISETSAVLLELGLLVGPQLASVNEGGLS